MFTEANINRSSWTWADRLGEEAFPLEDIQQELNTMLLTLL